MTAYPDRLPTVPNHLAAEGLPVARQVHLVAAPQHLRHGAVVHDDGREDKPKRIAVRERMGSGVLISTDLVFLAGARAAPGKAIAPFDILTTHSSSPST